LKTSWKYDATSAVCVTGFKAQKMELGELRDKVAKLEQADAYATTVGKRSQIYTRMGRGAIPHSLMRVLANIC
jgi:hypothetical protein